MERTDATKGEHHTNTERCAIFGLLTDEEIGGSSPSTGNHSDRTLPSGFTEKVEPEDEERNLLIQQEDRNPVRRLPKLSNREQTWRWPDARQNRRSDQSRLLLLTLYEVAEIL